MGAIGCRYKRQKGAGPGLPPFTVLCPARSRRLWASADRDAVRGAPEVEVRRLLGLPAVVAPTQLALCERTNPRHVRRSPAREDEADPRAPQHEVGEVRDALGAGGPANLRPQRPRSGNHLE